MATLPRTTLPTIRQLKAAQKLDRGAHLVEAALSHVKDLQSVYRNGNAGRQKRLPHHSITPSTIPSQFHVVHASRLPPPEHVPSQYNVERGMYVVTVFPAPVPDTPQQIKFTEMFLLKALGSLNQENSDLEEENILSMALHELARQVEVGSRERGLLIHRVTNLTTKRMHKLQRQLDEEREEHVREIAQQFHDVQKRDELRANQLHDEVVLLRKQLDQETAEREKQANRVQEAWDCERKQYQETIESLEAAKPGFRIPKPTNKGTKSSKTGPSPVPALTLPPVRGVSTGSPRDTPGRSKPSDIAAEYCKQGQPTPTECIDELHNWLTGIRTANTHNLSKFQGCIKRVMTLLSRAIDDGEKDVAEELLHALEFHSLIKTHRDQVMQRLSTIYSSRSEDERSPPISNVAIVFTDVESSVALWEALHPDTVKEALTLHSNVIRAEIRNLNGYEVKSEGDSFMVAFDDALVALKWCISVQEKLDEAPWSEELVDHMARGPQTPPCRGLRVRMGIHVGSPECIPNPVTGRMDYFGPVVNRAARISHMAHGGQTLLGRCVYDTVKDSFYTAGYPPPTFVGAFPLKGIGGKEEIWQVVPHSRTEYDFGAVIEVNTIEVANIQRENKKLSNQIISDRKAFEDLGSKILTLIAGVHKSVSPPAASPLTVSSPSSGGREKNVDDLLREHHELRRKYNHLKRMHCDLMASVKNTVARDIPFHGTEALPVIQEEEGECE